MKYYVFQDNGIIGPLTEEEIINNPNFNIDTLIQPENTEYWYKMRFLFKEVEDSKSTLQSIQSKENNQTETLNFTATDIIALPATINDDNDDLEIDKISKSSENEIVEKKLIDFIIIEANQKIDLIQKQFYSFLNNLDDYFEYRQLLEKRKIQIIVESLKKYYSENFSVLQKGVTDFIEFKVAEKERILKSQLEEEYKNKFEKQIIEYREQLKQELLKKFELDYEVKINKYKRELEEKFADDLKNYKFEIEDTYLKKYIEQKEKLAQILEPELKEKYEKLFEDKKQEFITEVYNKLETEYKEKLRITENVLKLEFAIDYAKEMKHFKELYDKEYKQKLRDEIYKELKETVMKTLLQEVKLERQKFKEDCEAQLEAERKLLELELKEELLRSKKILKENADKYIEEQIKKWQMRNNF